MMGTRELQSRLRIGISQCPLRDRVMSRTLWESRDQSRETEGTGQGRQLERMGRLQRGDCQGVPRQRVQTHKAGLASTRNGPGSRSMPHCATDASHSRPSARG